MSEVKSPNQIALDLLRELIESEFGDYSFSWKISETEEYDKDDERISFEVEYGLREEMNHSINFCITPGIKRIEVCMGEDSYQEINTHSWLIKYFWMNVKWD